MKQSISEQQLSNLPKRARRNLDIWAKKHGYSSQLSIGQMIDFLVQRKKDLHLERFDGGKKYSFWNISTCYDNNWKFGKDNPDLADALWEAINKELADK